MAGENGPVTINGALFDSTLHVRNLKQLRDDLVARLGFAAMLGSLPSGVENLMNSFLQDAHEQLYERYPLCRRTKWWTVPVSAGNRFYDVPYDGAYTGANNTIAFNDNDPAADTITISGVDFTTLGFASGTRFRAFGSTNNDGTIFTADTVTSNTITLVTTDTLTTEAAGADIVLQEESFSYMSFRDVYEAWIVDGTRWSTMIGGIPSKYFNVTTRNIPTHYELREFVEIFPEPDQAYTLYFKAHMGLQPFEVDTDEPSIDDRVLFLYALGLGKAHYQQPDAGAYLRQAEVLVGKYNAGNFQTKRFIPVENGNVDIPASYPQVTWPRP